MARTARTRFGRRSLCSPRMDNSLLTRLFPSCQGSSADPEERRTSVCPPAPNLEKGQLYGDSCAKASSTTSYACMHHSTYPRYRHRHAHNLTCAVGVDEQLPGLR